MAGCKMAGACGYFVEHLQSGLECTKMADELVKRLGSQFADILPADGPHKQYYAQTLEDPLNVFEVLFSGSLKAMEMLWRASSKILFPSSLCPPETQLGFPRR